MLRTIIAYAKLLAFFAHSALWLSLTMLVALRHPDSFEYYRVAGVWIRGILKIFGVGLRVEGLENIAPGGRYVILANHRSQLDPPCIGVALFPRVTRWVSKIELRRVPLLGSALVATGQIFIDRGNSNAAVDELRRHRNDRDVLICFFPEGHRSSARELLPFKKGGAAFAISAGLPVVPVAVSGSEKVLPNHSIISKPGIVRVAFGNPIPTDGLTQADAGALTECVRVEMQKMLNEMEGPGSAAKAA